MPRGRLYVIGLVTLMIVLAINNALTKHGAPAAPSTPGIDRPDAPEMNLTLEQGKAPVALSSLKGKVVVLDFWATWCGPCRESIPDLEKVYEKYHSQGLEVVGISVDETADPVPAAIKELGMTYPVMQASDIPGVREKFKFDSIPQMVIIDKQGRIGATVEGAGNDVEAAITPFLKE